MRLVIDGRRLTAGRTGVGRYLETLLAGWAITGPPLPETLVVLADPAGRDRVPRVEGLRAEVVGAGWPGLAWEHWALGRALRGGDLLFAPTNLVPAGWRGPTVLVLFDLIGEVLPETFPALVRWRFGPRYRRSARRADVVLVPSEATARDAARIYGVPPERLRVIPPGLDPGFHPRPPDAPDVLAARRSLDLGDAPFFLFVGKRSRRRNVPALLAAFDRLRPALPHHHLVFVGHPPDGLAGPRILDPGHIPEPILHALISAATALVYPSDYEGFGLPIAEALASGCPVVTLRNSALTEAGGDAPLYLDAARPDLLAAALSALATRPALRAHHVALGLAHAARFDRARFAAAVAAELVSAIADPRNSGRRPRMGRTAGV